jgi:hypothetical protein
MGAICAVLMVVALALVHRGDVFRQLAVENCIGGFVLCSRCNHDRCPRYLPGNPSACAALTAGRDCERRSRCRPFPTRPQRQCQASDRRKHKDQARGSRTRGVLEGAILANVCHVGQAPRDWQAFRADWLVLCANITSNATSSLAGRLHAMAGFVSGIIANRRVSAQTAAAAKPMKATAVPK